MEGDDVRQVCKSSSKTTPGRLLGASGSGPLLPLPVDTAGGNQPHPPILTEEGEPVSAMRKKGCTSEAQGGC